MESFIPSRGGWASRLYPEERRFLLYFVLNLVALLDVPCAPEPLVAREGESDEELAVLAALDFVESDEARESLDDDGELDASHAEDDDDAAQDRAAQRRIIERLFPRASRDAAIADPHEAVHRERLRLRRSERLVALALELDSPSGPGGTIFVPRTQVDEWLAAINDLRLATSALLRIDNDADAEALHRWAEAYGMVETVSNDEDDEDDEDDDIEDMDDVVDVSDRGESNDTNDPWATWEADYSRSGAEEFNDAGADDVPDFDEGTVIAYSMLSWWQESLLSCLLDDEPRG